MSVAPYDLFGGEGEDGFGEMSAGRLEELNKALAPGYETDHSSLTDGNALRLESLESSLKIVTFEQRHFNLWRALPKQKAFSTVEEWNVLSSYGTDGGGFMLDGELPDTEDSTYARNVGLVKFMGTTREITWGMSQVRTGGGVDNAIARETMNGIIWMLRKLEYSCFWGDSGVIPVEFDGLFTQLNTLNAGTENVIDLAGEPLDQETMETGSRIIADNYGQATDFWGSNKAISDLGKQMYPKERIYASGPDDGKIGTAIRSFLSETGDITFHPNVFLKTAGAPPTVKTNDKSPDAPGVVAGSPGAHAASKFVTADAGAYYYKVTALNRYGESAASAEVGPVTAVAGSRNPLTITAALTGGTATGYKIYRTEKAGGSGNEYYITKAAKSGASQVWYDYNEWRANTTHALMLQLNEQGVAFKQLSPLVKMPLAQISASIRWMQLMAGLLAVYAPKKHVIIKNIGTYVPA